MAQGRLSDAECDAPCTGDDSQMCGGTWKNSIYSLSTNFWEMPGAVGAAVDSHSCLLIYFSLDLADLTDRDLIRSRWRLWF